MTFIFDLPNAEMLPLSFEVSDKIKSLAKEADLGSLRTAPKEGQTVAETAKQNLWNMYAKIVKDYPEQTAEVTDALWRLEDGETAPNSYATINRVMTSKVALDFFTFLMQLV